MNKDFTYTVPHMESIDATAKAFGLSSYAVRKLARSRRGAAFLNCEALDQDTPEPDRRQTSAGIQSVPVRL